MKTETINERLEYLRGEIKAERISYGEIMELQSLVRHISPDDAELMEWACSSEHCEHQWRTVKSHGAMGHDSKCVHCGETATFTESDTNEP